MSKLIDELAPTSCVIVPYDFSDPARRAVVEARALVEKPGDLHIAHVLEHTPFDAPGIHFPADQEQRRHRARTLLEEEIAGSDGEGAHLHVILGEDAAGPIAHLAKELHADLIVLPTRGRTGLARVVLGSVAERLLRLAPCSVLVLPPRSSE